MGDIGKISDRGKDKVISTPRSRDFIKNREKLEFDPNRDIMKGGGDNDGSSSSDSKIDRKREAMKESHKSDEKELYAKQSKQIDQARKQGLSDDDWNKINALHEEQRRMVRERHKNELEALEATKRR